MSEREKKLDQTALGSLCQRNNELTSNSCPQQDHSENPSFLRM